MIDFIKTSGVKFRGGSLNNKSLAIDQGVKLTGTHYHYTLRGTEKYLLKLDKDGVAYYGYISIERADH